MVSAPIEFCFKKVDLLATHNKNFEAPLISFLSLSCFGPELLVYFSQLKKYVRIFYNDDIQNLLVIFEELGIIQNSFCS